MPLGIDPERSILVKTLAENWTLRPLGACGALRQCGLIRMSLEAEDASFEPVTRLSATATGTLSFANVNLGPETRVTLEVRLVDPLGVDYVDPERLPDAGTSCSDIPECDQASFILDADCGLDLQPADMNPGNAASADAGAN